MLLPEINIVLPLVTLIVGGAVTFVGNRFSELGKQQKLMRDKAYSSYIAGVVHASKTGYMEQLTEAKVQILIFGSSRVIRALVKFEKLGAVISGAESEKAFVQIILAMKENPEKLDDQTVHQLLLRNDRTEKNS